MLNEVCIASIGQHLRCRTHVNGKESQASGDARQVLQHMVAEVVDRLWILAAPLDQQALSRGHAVNELAQREQVWLDMAAIIQQLPQD
mgnify:CR=1 FL=1